jgi:hypothetical protein
MIKIETNSVFFGEKGLTSTSAQHIKDMAGHMNENLKEQLNGIRFVTDEVKLLGSQSKEVIAKGWDRFQLGQVENILDTIANVQSLQAWLGEAIQVKNMLSQHIQKYDFRTWLVDNGLELPQTQCVKLLTEAEWLDSLDIKTRNRYLTLQTLCAVYGQFIHPKMPLDKAKKYLQTRLNEPVEVTGSGRDSLVYYFTPSVEQNLVDEVYYKLQAKHRAAQAEFNKLKHEYEIAADEYRQKQIDANEEIKAQSNALMQEYLNQYQNEHQEMTVKIRGLKIQIPDHLKDIYEAVNKLGK